jgi:RNA polymerase sigma factor (sigma-70 family)
MRSNGFDWFMNQLGRWPLLTPVEEIELTRLYKAGAELTEKLGDRKPTPRERAILRKSRSAADRMVNCNLRLVVSLAKPYANRAEFLEIDDFVQVGIIGLRRAVELFDPERGYKFSTYASWWIRQAMVRELDQADRLIRTPQHQVERWRKIKRAAEAISHEGRVVRATEVAERAEVKLEDYHVLALACRRVSSLDASHIENDNSWISNIPDESNRPTVSDYDFLRSAVNSLSDEERDLITARYGLDGAEQPTIRALARTHGISHQAVCSRIQTAERKLRRILTMKGAA